MSMPFQIYLNSKFDEFCWIALEWAIFNQNNQTHSLEQVPQTNSKAGVHALNKPFIKTLSKDELKLFQILSVIISKINVKTHYAGYLLLMIQFEGQRDSHTKLQIENVVAFDRAKYCPIGLLNSKATNFSCRYFLVFTQSNYYYSLKVLSLI